MVVIAKVCTKCGQVRPLAEYRANSKAKDGLQSWCKECEREYQRKRARTHREEALERARRWREANRERFNEHARQYQARPGMQEQRRQYRATVRARVLEHYGTACACCGGTERLTVDHLDGNGGEHRREFSKHNLGSYRFYLWLIREGFPPGYQVLCLPCNQSKGKHERCRLWHGDPAYKRCADCGQVKLLDEFHRHAKGRSGRGGICKPCMAIRQRDWWDRERRR